MPFDIENESQETWPDDGETQPVRPGRSRMEPKPRFEPPPPFEPSAQFEPSARFEPSAQFEPLVEAFREQLLACLEECAAGRHGLFATSDYLGEAAPHQPWPEAERLRELAFALQSILAQSGEQESPAETLVTEFLDLCTIHGENDPGEPKLARAFLAEIEERSPDR